ncbi:MAG TPA: hypothetical protein VK175_07115 [Leadbetterella sp.]|nr:hypothetical protein [Leadbetterella sp.]
MRNNIMKILLFTLFAIVSFGQIGSKVPAQKTGLSGTWINKDFGYDMKLQLNDNGRGFFEDEGITYSVVGNKINMKFEEETIAYNYKLVGNVLTLSGGDLDSPVSFSKNGASVNTKNEMTSSSPKSVEEKNSKAEKLIGKWTTEGADIEFKPNGKGIYNGNPFTYTVKGNTLTSTDNTGTNTFFFMFLGESLSMSGAGINVVLTKGHKGYKPETATTGNYNSGGGIDQSIVGKWCWISSSGNYSASSSYSKCLNINSNGTYTYSSEGSISGYGGGYYGGSSSQSSDSGTWKIVGNKIHVQSRAEGFKIYSFEKRNHPKNGDPMIIIDGDSYVTYTQRPSWR